MLFFKLLVGYAGPEHFHYYSYLFFLFVRTLLLLLDDHWTPIDLNIRMAARHARWPIYLFCLHACRHKQTKWAIEPTPPPSSGSRPTRDGTAGTSILQKRRSISVVVEYSAGRRHRGRVVDLSPRTTPSMCRPGL
jgi:hypothetical protein